MNTLLLILMATLALSTNTQQFYSSTMFWNNLPLVNPATTGIENAHDVRSTFILPPPLSDPRNTTSLTNYSTLYKRRHGIGVNYDYTRSFFSQYRIAYSINFNNANGVDGKFHYPQEFSLGL